MSVDQWLAGDQQELLQELLEWWEDNLEGRGSYLVRIETDSDWDSDRVVHRLLDELVQRQPKNEKFFLSPTANDHRPVVDDPTAMPSYFAFVVHCSRQPLAVPAELSELHEQLVDLSNDLRASSSSSEAGRDRIDGLSIDHLLLLTEILGATLGGGAAVTWPLLGASLALDQVRTSEGFQKRYHILAPEPRRLLRCARSLAAVSETVPVLLVIDAAQHISPELEAFISAAINSERARTLVVAIESGKASKEKKERFADISPVHTISMAGVDARVIGREGARWLNDSQTPELIEAIATQVTSLGAFGRMIETPAIQSALKDSALSAEDVRSWIDPVRQRKLDGHVHANLLAFAAEVGYSIPLPLLKVLEGVETQAIEELIAAGWFIRLSPDFVRFSSGSAFMTAQSLVNRQLSPGQRVSARGKAPEVLREMIQSGRPFSRSMFWNLATLAATRVSTDPPDPDLDRLLWMIAEDAARQGALSVAVQIGEGLRDENTPTTHATVIDRWRSLEGGFEDHGEPLAVATTGLLHLAIQTGNWLVVAKGVFRALEQLEGQVDVNQLGSWWHELAERLAEHGRFKDALVALSKAEIISTSAELRLICARLKQVLQSGANGFELLTFRLDRLLQFALEAEVPVDELVDLHVDLCRLNRSLGRYGPALSHAEAVLRAKTRINGPNSVGTLAAMNNVAMLLQDLNRHTEALPLLKQNLKRCEVTLGDCHEHTLDSRDNLALCLNAVGLNDEAERLFKWNLGQAELAMGAETPSTMTKRNNLGFCLYQSGKGGEALPLLELNLGQRSKVLGDEHVDTLASRDNLAACLYSLGRSAEAYPLFEDNVASAEATLGYDHPTTLTYRNNLVACLSVLGRIDEALERGAGQLNQLSSLDLPASTKALTSRVNLAVLLRSLGNIDSAFDLLQEILGDVESRVGPEHPDSQSIRKMISSFAAD